VNRNLSRYWEPSLAVIRAKGRYGVGGKEDHTGWGTVGQPELGLHCQAGSF
jgi:hypothetical protein